jgi:phosphocarrier protein
MQEVTITIHNQVGLHGRPAALFVRTANQFKSSVTVMKGKQTASAKSILSVLALGVNQGAAITVKAEGEDEAQAIEAICLLARDNFGER